MRKSDRVTFEQWAKLYAENPIASPSSTPMQATAIKIHNLMSDGKFRTVRAISAELGISHTTARDVMMCIKDLWKYESSKSRISGGYRRISN